MPSPRTLLRAAAVLAGAGLLVNSLVLVGGAESDLSNQKLIALHGWSDLCIGLSCVAISATLAYLALRSRHALPFHRMILAFAVFILACGATHFMAVWTLRSPEPRYWLSGWVKMIAAFVSVIIAGALPPLIPKIRRRLEAARIAGDPALRGAATAGLRDGEESRWARAQNERFADPTAPPGSDQPLVLVAEDNHEMNDFICRVLGSELRTISAHSGRIALELARSRRPDLILTDILLPELTGEELVLAVRQEPALADVPIIMLTARSDEGQKISMLARGAQDYVVKPFHLEELRARVRNQVVAKVTRDMLRRELDSQGQDLAQLARELAGRARELEHAKNEAEAANRAKDQFLAVLSHELRTPLTPALAAASNLEQIDDVSPEELRESLALIRRNIDLEARLVDDLLDLTRISKGKLEIHVSTIDLHETIRHAAEMCRSEANNKGCELRLALEAGDRHVAGDGARLAQVFWNLMLNAVKFTPEQGCVGVHTSNPAPGLVRIEVSDTGIGIEPAMLSRIFEPFQQGEESTTRRFGGLGLGLSVAKGLVDAHHGSIRARSDGRDRGATFSIELRTIVPPAGVKATAGTPFARVQRALHILLVEDHADTRKALERLLTRWGHRVTSAPTVTHALEAAGAEPPQIILSDVGLPDGTGMDLLGRLRRAGLHVPAIAMSGYGMESDLEQTRDAGFCEHLVKPVAAERLREVLERVGAG